MHHDLANSGTTWLAGLQGRAGEKPPAVRGLAVQAEAFGSEADGTFDYAQGRAGFRLSYPIAQRSCDGDPGFAQDDSILGEERDMSAFICALPVSTA